MKDNKIDFYTFVNSDKPYHIKSLFGINGNFLQGFLMTFYNVKNLTVKDGGCGQKTGQEDSPLKEVCTQRKKKRRHWVYTTKPNP